MVIELLLKSALNRSPALNTVPIFLFTKSMIGRDLQTFLEPVGSTPIKI
jgi:hypothetical protein